MTRRPSATGWRELHALREQAKVRAHLLDLRPPGTRLLKRLARGYVGKTSTSPPRATAGWPRSSARSTRVHVAGERERLRGSCYRGCSPRSGARRIGSGRDTPPAASARQSAAAEASDEPAGREACQRHGHAPDRMRCRVEARAPVDAATREHCDAFLAEKPTPRPRRRQRVLILGSRAGRADDRAHSCGAASRSGNTARLETRAGPETRQSL